MANASSSSSSSSTAQSLNGMQHRATPTVGFSLPPETMSMKPGLSTMREALEEEVEEEGDEVREEDWDNELSAEAQAHNISMFLSSSTSDSGTSNSWI